MRKILIFGNSGAGKSTLAQELKTSEDLSHLDLDTLAWLDSSPPQRAPIRQSQATIQEFVQRNPAWVIEGCYSDLLELVIDEATELVYLNIPVEQCVENARNREWEPHKYPSRQAQDENLDMLISWIRDYSHREDEFSQAAHSKLYHDFRGKKRMYTGQVRRRAQQV